MGVLRAFAVLAVEQIEATIDDDGRRDALQATIGQLLDGGDLRIVHQPIIGLHEGTPVGVECLARFPDMHLRSPDKWFGEACEIGRGLELELLAVRRALETMPYVPTGCYVSINASPETILSGALERLLDGHEPGRLVIEVTEHQQVENFVDLKAALARVRRHARIAIDDVGAGYAGLRFIVDLAPDLLKLDMSLTRDVHQDPARRALTTAMVRLAAEIGCKLVAEGIEKAEERDVLTDLGIDYGQGYLFAAPMPLVASQQYLLGVSPIPEKASVRRPVRRRLVA